MPGEQAILLFDESVFCSGRSGFVITTERIFYRQLWDKDRYFLSNIIGFVRQEKRFGFAVQNGEKTFIPFYSEANTAEAAQTIVYALETVRTWLNQINEAMKSGERK